MHPTKPRRLFHRLTRHLTFAILIAGWATAHAATVSLYPIDDAFVRAGTYASTPFGALPPDNSSLMVKYVGDTNDYTRYAYLKFDLSDTTGTVQSATLYLKVRSLDTAGTGLHYLKEVTDDVWAEADIAYDNRPTAVSATVLASWVAPDAGQTVMLDLTDLVNGRGDDHLSLVIYSTDARAVTYYSKERNTEANWPRLEVTGDYANAPGARGRVRMEYWEGLTTPTVVGMRAAAGYPNQPTGRDYPSTLETIHGFRDNYGVWMRGYFHPPVTGDYIFYVSGADEAHLYLSADHTASNLAPAPVAEATLATGWREWNAQASQQSTSITLVGGQKYYFEAMHAAGTGDDHFSIGWRLPDGTLERPVPGDRVSPYLANEWVPNAVDLLTSLATDHPRIMASEHSLARVRERVESDSEAKARWIKLRNDADGLLPAAPSEYVIVTGRLLSISRQVLSRVETLAMAYKIGGDPAHLRRAWDEMFAACRFPDWHPAHFLDTAEMTAAMAIGYDWLYDDLETSQRLFVRNAIRDMGLQAGIAQYDSGSGWPKNENNWNQVCNGGMGMGALAIAEDEPTIAAQIAEKMLANYRLAYMVPDGGWAEGPGYWGYATQYMTFLFSTAETALGAAYGLPERLGMSRTGFFPIYMNRPSHQSFSFSDASSSEVTNSPQHYWMGWRYGYPSFGRYQREYDKTGLRELLWYDSRGQLPGETPLSLDYRFESCGAAMMRSSWDWGYPTFAGLKAGDNHGGHWHLDIGAFVLDALGQDFAIDLGGNNYGTVGESDYFSESQRWKYYKVRAEGHNTLMLNPDNLADQAFGVAPITARLSNAEGAYTIADLTPAYKNDASSVRRGILMRNYRREAIVQDEVSGLNGAKKLYWFMHTRADVQITDAGRSAILSQSGQRLWVHMLDAPAAAVFSVMDAVPLPTSPVPTNGQDATTGIRKLAIYVSGQSSVRLAIWCVPLRGGEIPPAVMPTVTPLDSWNTVTFNDAGTGFGAAPRPALVSLVPPAGWNPDAGNLTFRVYSGSTNRQIIPVVAYSENPDSEGADYYLYNLTADWVGWKQFSIPIANFTRARSPLGWDHVSSVDFRVSGWNAVRLADSVLNAEGLETAPRGDLFGDLPAPQENLLFNPPDDWHAEFGRVAFDLYSYAATGQRVLLLCMSENGANGTDPDYYSKSIYVTWTGWQHFDMALSEFGVARTPLGWDQLNEIRFYTNGWGVTLTTGTVLSLGSFETVLPGYMFGNHPAPGPDTDVAIPANWDATDGAVDFDLYSNAANGQIVRIVFASENSANESTPDYYACTIGAHHTGWQHFNIPLDNFAPTGQPLGWDHLSGIAFQTSGGGAPLLADSYLSVRNLASGISTASPTPTPTATPVMTPTPNARFETDQAIAVASDGHFYAVLYNLTAGTLADWTDAWNVDTIGLALHAENWYGAYVYDYGAAVYLEGMYVYRYPY